MDDITVMYSVICHNYLKKLNEDEKTIKFILSLLNNNVVESSKDHKHNPLSLAIDKVIFNKEKNFYTVRYNQKER